MKIIIKRNLNESLSVDTKDKYYNALTNDFIDEGIGSISNKPIQHNGACFILPDGRFMYIRAHGLTDEFLMNNFEEYDPVELNLPNGFMLDIANAIRCNDGAALSGDRYIQLPETITTKQKFALSDWLETFEKYAANNNKFSSLYVEYAKLDSNNNISSKSQYYDILKQGADYIYTRICNFYSSGILHEDKQDEQLG